MKTNLIKGKTISLKRWILIAISLILIFISISVNSMVDFSTVELSSVLMAISFALILSTLYDLLPSTSNFDFYSLIISLISSVFSTAFVLVLLTFFNLEIPPLFMIALACVSGTFLGSAFIFFQKRQVSIPSSHPSSVMMWYCPTCGYKSVNKFKRCPECRTKTHF